MFHGDPSHIFTKSSIFTIFINIGIIVNMRPEIATGWVLRYLKQIGPVEVRMASDGNSDEGYDLALSVDDGREQLFDVKHVLSLSQERATAFTQTWRPRSSRIRLLLAVPELSPQTRDFLRKRRLSWIEQNTGICHIVAPGVYIDTQVQDTAARPSSGSPTRLRDRTGLIAESILKATSRQIRLTSIAEDAGVSTALVSRLFQRLTQLSILDEQGAGPNRTWTLVDFGALLELWSKEERQPDTTTNLYVWSRTPQALYEKLPVLWQFKVQWAIGGVAAANLYAPVLTVPPAPIIHWPSYVPPQELAKELNGEIVEKGGNLQIWQSKGDLALPRPTSHLPEKGGLVDPRQGHGNLQKVSKPRAYIETVHAAGRGPEVAQALREQMLKGSHA